MSIRHKKLPIAALERIDDLCAEFEQAWQSDEPPTIESVLAADVTDVERDVLLAELIVLDVDYRRRRGDKPTKQEYLDRFPDHTSAINEALHDDEKKLRPFATMCLPIEHRMDIRYRLSYWIWSCSISLRAM